MSEELIEFVTKQGQECIKLNPVIVVGSGASAPLNIPGMRELTDYIKENVNTSELTGTVGEDWNKLKIKLENTDIESALQTGISDDLRTIIESKIWECINEYDYKLFQELPSEDKDLPLEIIFRYLTTSSIRNINVVTTNYDRVVEYSAELAKLNYYTGVNDGNIGYNQINLQNYSTSDNFQKIVQIWKVHGSLNLFKDYKRDVVSISPVENIPSNCEPIIVTPGIDKFEITHREPFRTIIKHADDAFEDAKSVLCVGFGFNDSHITTKLEEKLNSGTKLVILAMKLSDNTMNLLRRLTNCEYIAIEKCNENSSRVFSNNSAYNNEIVVNSNFWQFSKFLTQVIGNEIDYNISKFVNMNPIGSVIESDRNSTKIKIDVNNNFHDLRIGSYIAIQCIRPGELLTGKITKLIYDNENEKYMEIENIGIYMDRYGSNIENYDVIPKLIPEINASCFFIGDENIFESPESFEEGLPRVGTLVNAVLLEGVSKEENWRADYANGVMIGPILDSHRVPDDKKPGDEVNLLVLAAHKTNAKFGWSTTKNEVKKTSTN